MTLGKFLIICKIGTRFYLLLRERERERARVGGGAEGEAESLLRANQTQDSSQHPGIMTRAQGRHFRDIQVPPK